MERARMRRPRRRRHVTGQRTALIALLAALVSIGAVIVGIATTSRFVGAPVAAATGVNLNCTLIVPPAPLSARGLGTPYLLTATNPADGPCNEANASQSAFVQAAVVVPGTGKIAVYDPLVTDSGKLPAVAPAIPPLPTGAVVGIWFGFNGNTLALVGADRINQHRPAGQPRPPVTGDGPASGATPDPELNRAHCIAGQIMHGTFSSFTQMAACNAAAFFKAAHVAIAAGRLRVPGPGMAMDRRPCPTTRGFGVIDQDQSDNVTTEYLVTSDGRTAQDSKANHAMLPAATMLFNGSDNGLVDFFLGPALGCVPWTAPGLTIGASTTALPLDELQAAVFAGRTGDGPAALVPLNDPMTVAANGDLSSAKTDTYRLLVDQPPLPAGEQPGWYCSEMESIQGTRIQQDANLLTRAPSPLPAVASNLFTFMAARLQQSFVSLGCKNFGLRNDVTTTVNAAGVTVAACFLRPARPVTPGQGNPMQGVRVCPPTLLSPKPFRRAKPSVSVPPRLPGSPSPVG